MSRGPAFVQRINDDVADQILFTNNTLNATPSGAVSTAVLRFNVAGTLTGPFGVSDATTANEGTIMSITEPGVYSVELTVSQTGAVSNIWGIGFNQVTPITLVSFAAGATHVVQLDSNAAEVTSAVITGLVRINNTLARQAGGVTVRGLGQATAGGAPVPGAVLGSFAIRITKLWEVAF